MRFQALLSLWSVASCLCIDEIPEVAKTKVSKPKRYSLSKLGLCHAPLKRRIQTRPMSTPQCVNICIMQPKCSCKEKRCGFSNCSSVDAAVCVCVCVCVCERERERETRSHPNRGLCTANTYELHHCVCHVTLFPLGLELKVKLRTLLTVFIFILKAKACDNGKGHYISDSLLWCSSNHNALGQLANQSRLRLSEGGTL